MNTPTPATLVRWLLKLSEFDFRIEHRPGKLHNNVDALSRPPFVNRIPTVNLINTVDQTASKYALITNAKNFSPNKEISVNFVEHIALQGFSNQQLRQLQKEDNTLALFFDFIENKNYLPTYLGKE